MKLRALCPLLLALAGAPAHATEPTATPPSYTQVSAQTRQVAERYFQAYVRKDWASLFPLMGEQIRFRDPTATLVFGDLDQAGRPALQQYLAEVYAYIDVHAFRLDRSYFAGQQAVFIGESDWTIAIPGESPIRSRTPIVIALKVQGGQVLEHLEMADLQAYVDGVAQLRKKAQAAGG